MTLLTITIGFLLCMFIGYFVYGSYLAKVFALNAAQPTPAHTQCDDETYIPTKPFYLFCQHFSAIAASGPIAGPILACQKWGWLPCMLWISIGVIFIGAVHDFSALTASIRHGGGSIAQITKKQLGNRAGLMLLCFIWLALIYIIVAFTEVTAASFVSATEELENLSVTFNKGGAVAASSVFYLLLCMVFGLVNRFTKIPLSISSLIFVPAVFAVTWMGTQFSTLFIFDQLSFELIIIAYCALASLSPIWVLLQPRGYLGGFVLFFVLAIGVSGLLFGNFAIKQPAIIETSDAFQSMFPFLFVTIACGACSGFHGLVCSGTTSKQLSNEKHAQPIGFGAMLAEAFVALIALSTIMIFTTSETKGLKPGAIYGLGIGEFLSFIIGPQHKLWAMTFGAMAFSTFVFDTLDVATRIGRYLIQELFGWAEDAKKYHATAITLMPPVIIMLVAEKDSWLAFWTIFGTANQLLAALTLFSITIWLANNKKSYWITLLPMAFILCVTLNALVQTALQGFFQSFSWISFMNAVVASILLLLALFIIGTNFLAKIPPLKKGARGI